MRFCGPVPDRTIHDHCARYAWRTTSILGAFAGDRLHGTAELHWHPPDGGAAVPWTATAEVALSVARPMQNRGLGTVLLHKALVLARNRFVAKVFLVFLAENAKMQHISRKFGAALSLGECGIEGWIYMPWPSYLSLLEEAAIAGQPLLRAAFDPRGSDG